MDFDVFGKKLWIAKRLTATTDSFGNEIPNYDKPQEYFFNYQPVTSQTELEAFGIVGIQMMKAICSRLKYENVFKEFDLAYLDGATPDGEIRNGQNANYRIYGNPLNQNLVTTIYFEKIVKDNENE